MPQIISITDVPISCNEDNLLGVENYATALSDFILYSATPLTIGIQGEWGTGKTSLMNLIREKLAKADIATSWVNTWEYSLFKQSGETTPAVLRGMLEKLKESCGDEWTISQGLTENIAKKLWSFGSNVTNQLVKNHTGVDVKKAANEGEESKSITYTEIAFIKKEIGDLIQKLVDDPKNKFKKVVFFLDDLDRIEPPLAVEILEALKNIFDIKNCIFVLAIDYDVVIKGLEKKFGIKTDKNEREFRSFFDKIIQVPFTMPTGRYDIDQLLKKKLQELGLSIDTENDLDKEYLKLVNLTVGGNPRSIKRYINTYSLLKKIAQLSEEGKEPLVDFCLFALLGIQISYPTIFRLLNKHPDFPSWNEKLAKQYDIEDLSLVSGDHQYTDEPWEKILFLICQKDSYLKPRALNIIEILNVLREKCEDDLKNHINKALEIASITAVDDHEDSKQTKGFDQELRVKNKKFMVKLANKLNEKFYDNPANTLLDRVKATQSHGVEYANVEGRIWFDKKNKISAMIGFAFQNTDYCGYVYGDTKSEEATGQLIDELKKIFPEMDTEIDEDDGTVTFSAKDNDEKLKHEDFYTQFEIKAVEAVDKITKLDLFKTK
jgi:hypothetical protein